MAYVQKYSLAPSLPKISRHDQLPEGSIKLASLIDSGNGDEYTLVRWGSNLVVLVSYILQLKSGDRYSCHQHDFPLAVLSWFPAALSEFRKSPAEGGLPAGVIATSDVDVEGEMLSINSTTTGYSLTNWSRKDHRFTSEFKPMDLQLNRELLFHDGLLTLMEALGQEVL